MSFAGTDGSVKLNFNTAVQFPSFSSTSTIIPSVPVSLPFDPQQLAASPDTLRTANLWPNDAILQELLKTVIQIAAHDASEDESSFVLTTPAAVSLAGCAMRIAMYLVSQAIESALQRFEHGGWSSAASPMPRSIIESWRAFVQEQAEKWAPESKQVIQPLTSEAQQAVLAAIVVEWIRQLLKSMRSAAIRYKSPLLTAACLYEFMPSSGTAADIFNKLFCSVIIDIEHSPFKLMLIDSNGSSFTSPLFMSNTARGVQRIVNAENDAARLLLHKSSWFHHPHASRCVAQGLISGEKKLHASDILLNKMGIRLLEIHSQFLPSPVFAGHHAEVYADRLMLLVTDAAGCQWHLDILTDPGDRTRGALQSSSKPIATFCTSFDDSIDVQHSPSLTADFFVRFASTLSDAQQAILKQLQQSKDLYDEACNLNKSFLQEVCEDDVTSQLGGASVVLGDIKMPQTKSQPWDPLKEVRRMWRMVAAEQLTAVAVQFLDYSRWGLQRYEGEGEITEAARRQFQSYLIDAVMQASHLPLLPTVILDLIADYDTMEVLPYITNEEQTALLQQSVSDEALCSILQSM